MTLAVSPNHLTIRLNEAQLGYLSFLYPGEDLEEALVKLLECDRLRALRRAERKVEVLHPDDEGECDQPAPAPESSLPAEPENSIGTLHEYCQSKALPTPTYEFEDVTKGFSGIRFDGECYSQRQEEGED